MPEGRTLRGSLRARGADTKRDTKSQRGGHQVPEGQIPSTRGVDTKNQRGGH